MGYLAFLSKTDNPSNYYYIEGYNDLKTLYYDTNQDKMGLSYSRFLDKVQDSYQGITKLIWINDTGQQIFLEHLFVIPDVPEGHNVSEIVAALSKIAIQSNMNIMNRCIQITPAMLKSFEDFLHTLCHYGNNRQWNFQVMCEDLGRFLAGAILIHKYIATVQQDKILYYSATYPESLQKDKPPKQPKQPLLPNKKNRRKIRKKVRVINNTFASEIPI